MIYISVYYAFLSTLKVYYIHRCMLVHSYYGTVKMLYFNLIFFYYDATIRKQANCTHNHSKRRKNPTHKAT